DDIEHTVVNATDNWWDTNSDPTSVAGLIGAAFEAPATSAPTITSNPWLVLSNSASPGTINVTQTSTLTADFKHDSNGTDVSASDPAPGHTLPAFTGLTVTYGVPVDGTLSGQQTTIQSGGTATATYTGTTGGSGSSSVTVDGVTVTAHITVNASSSATTITSLTSSTGTSTFGTSVSFTATVNPTSATG